MPQASGFPALNGRAVRVRADARLGTAPVIELLIGPRPRPRGRNPFTRCTPRPRPATPSTGHALDRHALDRPRPRPATPSTGHALDRPRPQTGPTPSTGRRRSTGPTPSTGRRPHDRPHALDRPRPHDRPHALDRPTPSAGHALDRPTPSRPAHALDRPRPRPPRPDRHALDRPTPLTTGPTPSTAPDAMTNRVFDPPTHQKVETIPIIP